jgi:autotransporter-associated beta strand protein
MPNTWNLLADGTFSEVDLASGAPGVTTNSAVGNYTSTPPIGWIGSTSGVGAFDPTATSSPPFAGEPVAYLNEGATLSQAFATPAVNEGSYGPEYQVTIYYATRHDVPATSGNLTFTISVGSTVLAQETVSASTLETDDSYKSENVINLPSLGSMGLAGKSVTVSISNGTNGQVLVASVQVQPIGNLENDYISDGTFASVNLASGATGVTTDTTRGNYTTTAPPNWSFTQGSGGAFAPTTYVSDSSGGSPMGFAGEQVAYINPSSTIVQTFGTPTVTSGTEAITISLNLGTRIDGPPTTGTVTITALVGSTVVGQTTFNAVGATVGVENPIQLTTEDLNALGLAGQNVTLKITNGTNAQLLVGDVEATATPFTFDIDDGTTLANVLKEITVGGSEAYANTVYTINIDHSFSLTSQLPALDLMTGSSLTIEGTTSGANAAQVETISGAGAYEGFFAYAGNITLENLAITDAVAQGGAGGSPHGGGGGGGAGLGGGLFVSGSTGGGGSAHVSLENVSFSNDAAKGGEGVFRGTYSGIGGALDSGIYDAGIGQYGGGGAGANGGQYGGQGGFGGGGGGGGYVRGGAGGFGGGGGIGSASGTVGAGGFGGGPISNSTAGGGLGAGGDVFVQQGGSLTIEGSSLGAGTLGAGTVAGGISARTGSPVTGSAYGGGIFLQGNQSITLAPLSGQTLTIAGVIADMHGSNANYSGSGSLVIDGAGTVSLSGVNTYTGATTVEEGTLALGAGGSIASSPVTLDAGTKLDISGGGNQTVTIQSGATGSTITLGGNTLTLDETQATTLDSSVSGTGKLAVEGSKALTLAHASTYSGGTIIDSGATLTLATAGAAGSGSISFSGPGELVIDSAALTSNALSNSIMGYSAGDTIDLPGLSYVSGQTTTSYNSSTGKLTVSNGTTSVTLHTGTTSLAAESDGHGGTELLWYQSSYTVTGETALNTDIKAIDAGGSNAFANANYTIDITGPISLTTELEAINLESGSTLTIQGTNGSGVAAVQTINGNNAQRGFFVFAGNVTLENLTIANAKALGGAGGNGGAGGGGGAGLGGGLFVAGPTQGAAGGNVTLIYVGFSGDSATGGAGGSGRGGVAGGGGGGLGGAGGNANGAGGAGGGIGTGAGGGSAEPSHGTSLPGRAGIIAGAAGGGSGGPATPNNATGGAGGLSGGGGGAGGLGTDNGGGGGGGVGGGYGGRYNAAGGGFGGGGGAESYPYPGGGGGFGGGGGGGFITGGAGGFGGGGAGGESYGGHYGTHGGASQFGGGVGGNGGGESNMGTGGGGGLGAGGDIFVQQGGLLTIESGSISAGTVAGGAAGSGAGGALGATSATAGSAYGNGLFIQGNQSITLAPPSSQTLTVAGIITDMHGSNAAYAGSGSLVINGPGTVSLTAAETYTGATTIEQGKLSLGAGGSIAKSDAVTLAGGSLDISAAGSQALNNLSGAAGSTITLGGNTLTIDNTQSETLNSTITGSGALIDEGGQTLTLGGNSNYSGGTTVENGTLSISAGDNIGSGSLTLDNGTTLDITSTTILHPAIAITGDPTFDVTSGQTVTISGVISNGTGAGMVEVTGGGTLVLTADNTYTGGTTVEQGTLSISAADNIGTGPLTLDSGTTLDVTANATLGAITVSGSATLEVASGATLTLSGAIGGAGSITVAGGGTLLLNAASTYTGSTTVQSGTLAIGATGSIPTNNAVTLDAGGALDISAAGSQTFKNLSGATGSMIALGGNTLTLDDAQAETLDSAISGTGKVVDDDGQTLTLGGNSNYSGGTTVENGTLSISAGNNIGSGPLTLDGGTTLDVTASTSFAQGITLSSSDTIDVASGQNFAVGGAIGGSGNLNLAGGGTLVLSAADTSTGSTTIALGELALGAGGSIQSGPVTLDAGTTLDISAAGNATVTNLSGAASSTIALGGNTLTLDETQSETLDSAISGTGKLVVEGGKTLTLGGASTYNGGTTIEGGSTVVLGTAGAAGTGPIAFSGTDELVVDSAGLSANALANAITGFSIGDAIDLPGLTYVSGQITTSYNSSTGKLTVSNGAASVVLNIGTSTVGVANDGNNGTKLVDITTSFAANSEAALNSAIKSIDVGGSNSYASAAYTITITGQIDLTGDVLAINLAPGSSVVIEGTNGSGAAEVQTIDGMGNQRGFFAYAGNITLKNLAVTDAVANGGNAGHGGGGGAGLGGGLFIATGVNATLENVTFLDNAADGGAGGTGGEISRSGGLGGGGGMGGNGGQSVNYQIGGGGGLGLGANGAGNGSGAAGIVPGAAAGGSNFAPPGTRGHAGGASGGGGAGGYVGTSAGTGVGWDAGGGGIAGASGRNGGTGGFGGGGGGVRSGGTYAGAAGGFGGGGGGGRHGGGAGGFGGGGGGATAAHAAGAGGFGAGAGARGSAAGGGGLGAGGDVFIQQGGSLTIDGGSLSGGTVLPGASGGASSQPGQAYGSGIFIQGNQPITFVPTVGETITISDTIADEPGSDQAATTTGPGSLIIDGAGTVQLSAHNTYTGGTTVEEGGLSIAAGNDLGSGALTLDPGTRLDLTAGTTLTQAIKVSGDPAFTVGPGQTDIIAGVIADGASAGTVELTGGGTLVLDADNTYSGGTTVEAGSTLELVAGAEPGTGSVTLDTGATLDGAGTTTLTQTITGGGAVIVTGGVLDLDSSSNNYSGGSTIEDGGTLEIGVAGAAGSGPIAFSGTNDTLEIVDPAAGPLVGGHAVSGFVDSDLFDLTGVGYAAGATAQISGSQLDISDNGQSFELNLSTVAAYSGHTFDVIPDGLDGINVDEDGVACFCPGTLILTPTGEMPVEDLAVGDYVVTVSGKPKPIKWIGRRSYAGRFIAGNRDVLPIRITAGALAEGVPTRDLWVSPEHALYLEEMLVPARHLVNARTIVQVADVDSVEYFHIELDRHDVIFAEGAAAESFVDDDSRMMFHNAMEFFGLYSDEGRVPALYCAPRIEDGFALEAIHRRLRGRALRLDRDSIARPSRLEGFVDTVHHDRITGWAFDPGRPDTALTVVILANGAEIGRMVADHYRHDLQAAGIGDGRHAFSCELPGGLAADVRLRLEVYFETDGSPLTGSPAVLQPDGLAVAA